MPPMDDAISKALTGYAAAAHAKDVEALLSLYDAEVRVFDAWGTWSYEGLAAWRGAVTDWLGSLGEEKVRVSFSNVQVQQGADLAVMSAVVTYSGESASGESLRSMENRITWVFLSSTGQIRIVHEHTSAPIGFEDMKAILRR